MRRFRKAGLVQSFPRLKLHVGDRGSAIEEIVIKYNLLIVLPKTQRPQEYTINLKFISRVAKIENMREEVGDMPLNFPLYQLEKVKAAVFSIDYIDISVANSIMSLIKKWYNGIDKKPVHPAIKKVRSLSHTIPTLLKYSLLSIAFYYIYILSSTYLPIDKHGNRELALFIIFSMSAAFLSYRLGKYLGHKAERNIDSIYEHSYINFSSADEDFVSNSLSKIKKSYLKAISYITVTIILGIIGSTLANWLSN